MVRYRYYIFTYSFFIFISKHCVKSVRIFRKSPYSVRIQENTDQKKLHFSRSEKYNKSVTTYAFAFKTYKSYEKKLKSKDHVIKGSYDFMNGSFSQ